MYVIAKIYNIEWNYWMFVLCVKQKLTDLCPLVENTTA